MRFRLGGVSGFGGGECSDGVSIGDVRLGVCRGEDGQEGGRRGEGWIIQDGRTECTPPVHA